MLAGVALLGVACGSLPRDPEGTSHRVAANHVIRVGLSENPPWVIRTQGEPRGVEVQLVRDFAAQLHAQPQWFWGSEQQHMPALEHFQLDLVVGGLESSSPWKKSVGFTRPYFEERTIVGVPASSGEPQSLEGVRVTFRPDSAAGFYLQKKHAELVRAADLAQASGAVAAEDWRIEKLGLRQTRYKLFEGKHVIAVPPGENGWLKELETFLFPRSSQVKEMLKREAE